MATIKPKSVIKDEDGTLNGRCKCGASINSDINDYCNRCGGEIGWEAIEEDNEHNKLQDLPKVD